MVLQKKPKKKAKSNAIIVKYGKTHLQKLKEVENWKTIGLDIGVE